MPYKVKFDTGEVVTFNNQPTDDDIEEVVKSLKIKPKTASIPEDTRQSPSLSQQYEQKYNPTFAASETDSPLMAGLKTAGNIPKDALQTAGRIAKGTFDLLNPINTAHNISQTIQGAGEFARESGGIRNAVLNTAKEIPGTAYNALIPEAGREVIAGVGDALQGKDYQDNIQKAQYSITNDPVGQILPFLIAGRAAAHKAGYGEQFDSAISTIAKPVTVPASIAAKTASNAAGEIGSQVLGGLTGTGKASIKEAFNAGKSGIKNTDFSNALRGKIEPNQIVDDAVNALETIKGNRRSQYLTDLNKLGQNKKSIDITPIQNQLKSELGKFNIKVGKDGELDFSRATISKSEAVSDVESVVNTIRSWGSKPGDRTAVGLDILKKRLDDLYSPSGEARALVTSLKNTVKNTINEQVPEYAQMTGNYEKVSGLLKELRSGLSVGGRAGTDTALRKLSSAMKQNNEFRLNLVKQLQKASGKDLTGEIAGANLNPLLSRSLIGKGIEGAGVIGVVQGLLNPQYLGALLSTSPRIVGEFVQALGFSTKQAGAFIKTINEAKAVINSPAAGKLAPYKSGSKLPPGGTAKDPSIELHKLNDKTFDQIRNDELLNLGDKVQTTQQLMDLVERFKHHLDSIPNKQGGFIRISGVKAKNIHPQDAAVMKSFIDSVRVGKNISDAQFNLAEKLAEKFGISMDRSLASVATTFEDILSGAKNVKGTLVPGSLSKIKSIKPVLSR